MGKKETKGKEEKGREEEGGKREDRGIFMLCRLSRIVVSHIACMLRSPACIAGTSPNHAMAQSTSVLRPARRC